MSLCLSELSVSPIPLHQEKIQLVHSLPPLGGTGGILGMGGDLKGMVSRDLRASTTTSGSIFESSLDINNHNCQHYTSLYLHNILLLPPQCSPSISTLTSTSTSTTRNVVIDHSVVQRGMQSVLLLDIEDCTKLVPKYAQLPMYKLKLIFIVFYFILFYSLCCLSFLSKIFILYNNNYHYY